LRKGLWGLADHALLSGANAAGLLVLARVLPTAEFGRFVIAYATLVLANSVQTALVTQPHNVLGAARRGEEYRSYTSSTAMSQLAFAGLVALLAAAAAAALELAGARTAVVVALVPAALGWQLQEFVRRVLYTEGRVRAAFANDVVSYGGQPAAFVLLWRVDELTAATALYGLAATSLLGAGIGAFQLRGSFSRRWSRAAWRENWRFGKWLGGGAIAAAASVNLFFYGAAVFAGTAAAGTLKAAQLLLGPATVVVLFLGTVLPIRFAHALDRAGSAALRADASRAVMFTGPLVLVYSLCITVFADDALRLVYGGRYGDAGPVVALFALYTLVTYGTQVVAAALKAHRRTREIYRANMVTLGVSVTAGLLLVAALGATGAALGLIVAAAVGALVLVRGYAADVSALAAPPPGLETRGRG